MGESLADIEANMGIVIEGISNNAGSLRIAQELGAYMPITQAIYRNLRRCQYQKAITDIMSNEFKAEGSGRRPL